MSEDTTNALGLDFSQLAVNEEQSEPQPSQNTQEPEAPAAIEQAENAPPPVRKEKEKPYFNPERVKTGGPQRDKLSEEALEERIARIREQNEKIKQRRVDVLADEDAFRKTQEEERAKQAQHRKVQADVNRARDQNAKRKMDKIQNREWDSGKPAVGGNGQQPHRSESTFQSFQPPQNPKVKVAPRRKKHQ